MAVIEPIVRENDPSDGCVCLIDEQNDIAMSLQVVGNDVYLDTYEAADERRISKTLFADKATLRDWLEKAGVI